MCMFVPDNNPNAEIRDFYLLGEWIDIIDWINTNFNCPVTISAFLYTR